MKQITSYFIPSIPSSVPTHQVVDAQQQSLDAAVDLALSAGCESQVNPHQLGQELQGEAAQAGV